MKIINGDLLSSDVPAIIHQCNCFHTMKSGFAKQISSKYPEVLKADKRTIFGDKLKLGGFSVAFIDDNNLKYVFNLYSQYKYGRGLQTDYEALEEGLAEVLYYLNLINIKRVGIPYLIGCGLAGGSKKIVMDIIEKVQEEYPDIEIEIYKI